jgi:hypothetical protein
MTMSRKLRTVLLGGALVVLGAEAAHQITGSEAFNLLPDAQAVVGRPLTPVSVAGVARRTTRRCAAGVYNC